MATQQYPRTKTESMRALVEAGYTDVLVLEKETAESVLTEKRLERLQEGNVESVSALALELGRDKAAVSRDLDLLFEHDLVRYEADGSRKRPVLNHESVVIEPIL